MQALFLSGGESRDKTLFSCGRELCVSLGVEANNYGHYFY
jgi:hypothetical protein